MADYRSFSELIAGVMRSLTGMADAIEASGREEAPAGSAEDGGPGSQPGTEPGDDSDRCRPEEDEEPGCGGPRQAVGRGGGMQERPHERGVIDHELMGLVGKLATREQLLGRLRDVVQAARQAGFPRPTLYRARHACAAQVVDVGTGPHDPNKMWAMADPAE